MTLSWRIGRYYSRVLFLVLLVFIWFVKWNVTMIEGKFGAKKAHIVRLGYYLYGCLIYIPSRGLKSLNPRPLGAPLPLILLYIIYTKIGASWLSI